MPRGTLRVYLGAAPGVGTTYAMLAEGRRRAARGTDVVVAIAQTHGRQQTAAQQAGLEVVPVRHALTADSTPVDTIDVDAVITRAPQVALVDDLERPNGTDSRRSSRWQDVADLLDAGIDVVATLKVQHLSSLRDVVTRVVGRAEPFIVPDEFVRSAEQVELIDMTPEALRRRLAHGNIYAGDSATASIQLLYRPGTLGALRELALLWVADHAHEALTRYMAAHDIATTWETRERMVVAVTGAPGNEAVVRRAARMARRSRADLLGVHVRPARAGADPESQLVANQRLLLELGGSYHEVVSDDVARALVAFANAERATQLVLGESRRTRWHELRRGSVAGRVMRDLRDVDVHIIASHAATVGSTDGRRPRAPIARRRLVAAMAVAAVGLPVITVIGVTLRAHLGQSAPLLAYLLLVAAVSAIGGARPAVVTAVSSFALANWYFTAPIHTLKVNQTEDVIALLTFLSVAGIVAALVGANARRTAEAERARAEAEALAHTSAAVLGEADPLPSLLGLLRSTFALDSAAVLQRDGEQWRVVASVGDRPPSSPSEGEAVEIEQHGVLVLVGPTLGAEDRRVLVAFAAQFSGALTRRTLQTEAARAALLSEADSLRSAILQSVSHDLRTPLAAIKASVTTLLQRDVELRAEAQRDLLETIDEETDRLDRVIGNLLDMSRLQAGALQAYCVPVDVEDVMANVLSEVSDRVIVDVDGDTPAVLADAVLLERALVNLAANAVAWSPPEQPVRIDSTCGRASVTIRVSDRGPGIPLDQRGAAFEPFRRLGERSTLAGVGLGLAVARGFVQAMGGSLELDDTPGGGLTAVITLPSVVA